MSPLQIAAVSALVTTVVASFVPADRISDRQARSWVKKAWKRYRGKLLLIQLVATAGLAAGATQIGWAPEPTASAFKAAAQGIGWSAAAVALLRAEFAGLGAREASPGFSVLRSFSQHFTEDLSDQIADAARDALPADSEGMKKCGFNCKSRAHPPRADGSQTPDAKALGAAIELLAMQGSVSDLRELIVDTVIRHKLPKCW